MRRTVVAATTLAHTDFELSKIMNYSFYRGQRGKLNPCMGRAAPKSRRAAPNRPSLSF